MQMKQVFSIIILFFLTTTIANAQLVTNIRFEQSGKQVVIYYDISGVRSSTWNIEIYCSQDGGTTWGNPLRKLNGDFGPAIKPGTNKQIKWDVLDEREKLEGEISFKVTATEDYASGTYKSNAKPNYSAYYYKYKKRKTFWLISALVSSGVGAYAYLQSDKYYKQYQNATTDAADLHQKVQLFDQIYPIAFGIAGFCTVEFIIKAGLQGKAKKQTLSFYPQPLNHGAGLGLICKF